MKTNSFAAALLLAWLATATVNASAQETDIEKPTRAEPWRLGIMLFEGYELLDVMGPLEMFGNVGPALEVVTVSKSGGEVEAAQPLTSVADYSFDDCPPLDILLVPGGRGVQEVLEDAASIDWVREQAKSAKYVTSVCTGTAILAEAGTLDGYKATTNKLAYKRLTSNYDGVTWIPKARWVEDRDRITSSGVSAGIDMALHIIERVYGERTADRITLGTEYIRNHDPADDPFARE